MYLPLREQIHGFIATLSVALFIGLSIVVMRPSEPHPGLKDEALKQALRTDRDHHALGYLEARKILWSEIDGDGRKATDVYTGEEIRFMMQPLPNNGAVDHAWPLTRLPASARTDLHHMFAVTGESRLARLNLHYGKVSLPVWSRGGSHSGPSSKLMPVFEVRKEYRGDVARAMFYVATMYNLSMPADEEKILRQWHKEDPVSRAERQRNDAVQKRQKSRNPFVDHPGLVDRISRF
jgi:deoxyribonuclease I